MAFSKSHKQIVYVSNTAKRQNTFSTSSVIKVGNRIFTVLNDSEMKRKHVMTKTWGGKNSPIWRIPLKNLSAQLLFENQYKFLWTAWKCYDPAPNLMCFEYFFPYSYHIAS